MCHVYEKIALQNATIQSVLLTDICCVEQFVRMLMQWLITFMYETKYKIFNRQSCMLIYALVIATNDNVNHRWVEGWMNGCADERTDTEGIIAQTYTSTLGALVIKASNSSIAEVATCSSSLLGSFRKSRKVTAIKIKIIIYFTTNQQ